MKTLIVLTFEVEECALRHRSLSSLFSNLLISVPKKLPPKELHSSYETNWFVPAALAFPHKKEVCSVLSKCVLFAHPSRFEIDNDKARRRRSNWHRLCGLGEAPALSEWEVQEARAAVSSYLQELGVSEEDSEFMASKSTGYVKMLVEGVRDLEQLQWDERIAAFSFKDKILHIAVQKGDNGKLAYLETLGFSLSSSMNVATYLSAHTLASLMHKVTRMKQLFFSAHSLDEFHFHLLVKNIHLMMRHLSISTDEDLQHTLAYFEKLEARRGGLNILASQHGAFRYLIESFPRLLQLSVDNHFTHILDFLHNIGIPTFRISGIILAFPPLLFWNLQLLRTRVLDLDQIDVADKNYANLLLKYPWVLSTSIQQNYTEIRAFLYSVQHCFGGNVAMTLSFTNFLVMASSNMEQNTCPFPEIFAASINKTLRRKIEFLGKVGVSKIFLPGVIRKYPELLVSDTDKTLLQRIMYLMKLGLSEEDIAYMVRTFSPVLGYIIEGVLRPKIEFLVNSMERPVRDVVGYPRYFSHSLEKKIKPRHWVLKGRDIKCSLKDMLAKNDKEFAAEFMGIGRMLVCPPVSSKDSL
ncbi:hypothetical protein Fmac_013792 [Flemingia macrophylla]|uniref:Uncharacterized protein n=1 Tax=Flemingia macrophylla TaxID=520843 RepID=A0ABD1M9Y0_9FABA